MGCLKLFVPVVELKIISKFCILTYKLTFFITIHFIYNGIIHYYCFLHC